MNSQKLIQSRVWSTPVTIGAFTAVAVTGLSMFFDVHAGLIKTAHEWIGLVLIVGVVFHAIANWKGFVRYLTRPGSLVLILLLVAAGTLSFAAGSGAGGRKPPQMAVVQAMQEAPLTVAAQLAKSTPELLIERLKAEGIAVAQAEQTISQIAETNGKPAMMLLGLIFGQGTPTGPGED